MCPTLYADVCVFFFLARALQLDIAIATDIGMASSSYVAELEKNLSALERPATMLPNIPEMGAPLSPAAVAAYAPVTCGAATIAFSGTDGSIRSLTDITSGRQWVGNDSNLGDSGSTTRGSGSTSGGTGGSLATFGYQTYSDADFSHTYAREYTTSPDFMKPGMGDGPGQYTT